MPKARFVSNRGLGQESRVKESGHQTVCLWRKSFHRQTPSSAHAIKSILGQTEVFPVFSITFTSKLSRCEGQRRWSTSILPRSPRRHLGFIAEPRVELTQRSC